MIYQGFGWGVGSSLGRAATASILGGGQGGYATDAAPKSDARAVNPCEAAAEAFGRCVRDNARTWRGARRRSTRFQSCAAGRRWGDRPSREGERL